jgi:hypothetical protein
MYRTRTAADWHDALDWVFSAPDYVRDFSKKKRIGAGTSSRGATETRAARRPRKSTSSARR